MHPHDGIHCRPQPIGALVSSLHSGFGHQNGPCRRQSSAGVAFQTDWASSEQDRQRTRPTEDLCGLPLVDAAPHYQDCAAAGRHRACRRPESDGEKGCRCCCGLQGSCFEKGMAPNAVMRCRLAGLFCRNNSKQQQRLPIPTWSPVRGWRRGGEGGLLAPPPSPTNIAVHHKHEQQAESDGYASASWEGSRIPPSPPRRHDGSEIQGVEEGGEGIGMIWHGWDEMMARPRPRRTPHTSLCFPGRLRVDRCAAGLRYHGVAILEPRALSPPPSTAGRITAPLCRSGTELDWRTHQPMRYTSSTMRRRRRIDWQAQRTPHPRLAGGLMRSKRLELGGGPCG